mgnify:CR=1 FL=1
MNFLKKTKIFDNKARLLQIVGAVLVCGALLGVFLYFYITYGEKLTAIISDRQQLEALFAQFNNYDKLVFIAVRAFQTVIKIIPAEPLEIGSGYLYGTWGGLLCCMLGTLLGATGFYKFLFSLAGAGVSVPLVGFGAAIAKGVKEAVDSYGFLGIFKGPLSAASAGCTAALVFGFLCAIFLKGKPKRS